MYKARSILKKTILCLGGAALVLVSVLLFAQTVARYLFHYSFFWVEELCKYSIIWGVLLCASVGVSERSHTQLDFLQSKLPDTLRKIVVLVLDLIYFCFAAALAYYNQTNIRLGMKQVSPGLQIRLGYVYLALTVSMIVMMIFLCFNIAEDIQKLKASEKESK